MIKKISIIFIKIVFIVDGVTKWTDFIKNQQPSIYMEKACCLDSYAFYYN